MEHGMNYAETKALRKQNATERMHEALKSAATQAYRAHQSTGSKEAHRIFVALHNLRESTQDK